MNAGSGVSAGIGSGSTTGGSSDAGAGMNGGLWIVGDSGSYVSHYDGGAIPTTINSANWDETIYPPAKRRMLVRDEGDPHVRLVDFSLPPAQQIVWSTPTDSVWARNLQLIGNNQVLGGRSDGYEVYDLKTGAVLKRVHGLGNTTSVYRTANGETMLTQSGTTLTFLDAADKVSHTISCPGYGYVRTVRPTRNGTFLVPSDTILFEGDPAGNVLWNVDAGAPGWGHIEQALLMKDGNVILSTGYGASLDIIDKTTHTVTFRYGTKTMPDAGMFKPSFFSEFQILPNGNLITSNWQGGTCPKCTQGIHCHRVRSPGQRRLVLQTGSSRLQQHQRRDGARRARSAIPARRGH